MHAPDHRDIEYERQLKRVATRGVVALFNAINAHQRASTDDQTSSSQTVRQVKQLSKENFLNMLKKSSSDKGKTREDNDSGGSADRAGSTKPKWDVLRDDYGTERGASIKDWERHANDETEHPSGDDEFAGGNDDGETGTQKKKRHASELGQKKGKKGSQNPKRKSNQNRSKKR
mmetsp:Transcript_22350/g.30529  ORF Transcript_22350/g.30529 Transcript_22350/m.30529 type:complete len:174 (-) Transcript_22350:240-761(-)